MLLMQLTSINSFCHALRYRERRRTKRIVYTRLSSVRSTPVTLHGMAMTAYFPFQGTSKTGYGGRVVPSESILVLYCPIPKPEQIHHKVHM